MAEGVTHTNVIRFAGNPILTNKDVPYASTLVYNCGVTRYRGRYVMVFRNDYNFTPDKTWHKFEGINLGLAFSDDGLHWDVQSFPIFEHIKNDENIWAYDPRLTVLEGRCYLTFCLDTRHGMRAGIAVTDDFENYELLSLSVPDLRNVVLFPERVGGKYLRLERPFPIYLRRNWGQVDRFDLWMSQSPDLVHWGNAHLLLAVEQVPFANEKVGPGAPPIRTTRGWLEIFHAVETAPVLGKNGWEENWNKMYVAGVMLLDLEDPRKIIGMLRIPLLAPEASYEVSDGFRNNIVFPTGVIAEPGGELKIYYGAADTVICLATTSVEELVQACLEAGPV
jgi:beta-1,4-mannooligosaccharide/beta-1,4-mannosyl-N-acetylglucosamine phosphorylase